MTLGSPESAIAARSLVDDAEVLLSRRKRAEASELLAKALAITHDVSLLRRIQQLAAEGAAATRDGIAAKVLFAPIVCDAQQSIAAVETQREQQSPVGFGDEPGIATAELASC